jgi:hypothetical protein
MGLQEEVHDVKGRYGAKISYNVRSAVMATGDNEIVGGAILSKILTEDMKFHYHNPCCHPALSRPPLRIRRLIHPFPRSLGDHLYAIKCGEMG